jgi:hypothetical protein
VVHRIVAAIAEEIHIAGGEARRIDLEEAACRGKIEPIPVIVDA